MSDKHSAASKARWAKISPEERSRRMSRLKKRFWKNKSKKERSEYAIRLNAAKKEKREAQVI